MIEAATLRPGTPRLPDYLTTEEAAAELNYHPEHIRWMIRRGKLQADKKGAYYILPVFSLHYPSYSSLESLIL